MRATTSALSKRI
ncbi:hypothetical protein YPPY94_1830, partial [Yersinia pestis PY-94]